MVFIKFIWSIIFNNGIFTCLNAAVLYIISFICAIASAYGSTLSYKEVECWKLIFEEPTLSFFVLGFLDFHWFSSDMSLKLHISESLWGWSTIRTWLPVLSLFLFKDLSFCCSLFSGFCRYCCCSSYNRVMMDLSK